MGTFPGVSAPRSLLLWWSSRPEKCASRWGSFWFYWSIDSQKPDHYRSSQRFHFFWHIQTIEIDRHSRWDSWLKIQSYGSQQHPLAHDFIGFRILTCAPPAAFLSPIGWKPEPEYNPYFAYPWDIKWRFCLTKWWKIGLNSLIFPNNDSFSLRRPFLYWLGDVESGYIIQGKYSPAWYPVN